MYHTINKVRRPVTQKAVNQVSSFAIGNQLLALEKARKKLAASRTAIEEAQRLIDSSFAELVDCGDATVQRGGIRMALADASTALFEATTEIMLCRAFSDSLPVDEPGG